MSLAPNSIQRIRLKQTPTDVWSVREKLCLASSVLRSGDQNWSSVSRPLKAFGEPNRPSDWFNQKNCALQYSDLIEKIEMPKRKRSERGEDTAQDLIVRKLTNERIEELRKIVAVERDKLRNLKKELEMVKNGDGDGDDEALRKIWQRMIDERKAKEQAEADHKKWCEERDAKIAAMKASRGVLVHGAANRAKVISPVKPSVIKVESESSIDSPLSIDVEESASAASVELKIVPPHSGTTTSPLLTSLLQSPTPSTSAILSPSVTGIVSSNFTPVKDISSPQKQSVSVNQFFAQPNVTKHSPITTAHGSNASVITTPSSEEVTAIGSPTKSPTRAAGGASTSPIIAPSSSPTLSKLLEMPPSEPGKLPPLPVIEQQTQAQDEVQNSGGDILIHSAKQISPKKVDSNLNRDEIEMTVSHEDKNEDIDSSLNEKQIKNNDNDPSLREDNDADNVSGSVNESVSNEDTETNDSNINSIVKTEPTVETSIATELSDESTISKIEIKEEPLDVTPSNDDSQSATPSTRVKRRKTQLPPTNVPATRRSGRVKALRNTKAQEEPEENEQTPVNTPIGAKKRVSVDETTETSMSEESMDAQKANASSQAISESIPNSPASSTMHSEDAENIKEYKLWKKSIMLAWRTAATHKFASLFLQPVTDDEAAGYSEVVYKRMDLQSIRKRIENGQIRTTAEFQRDIMIMFQNAIMYNTADHDVHQMAVEMQKEIIESIEDFIETQQQTSQTTESKLRGRERRSAASAPANTTIEEPPSGRRKSRGASTDTESGTSNQTKSSKKKTPNSKN